MSLPIPATDDSNLDALMAADPIVVAARLLERCFRGKDAIAPSMSATDVVHAVPLLYGGTFKARLKRTPELDRVEAIAFQSLSLWERALLAAPTPFSPQAMVVRIYVLHRGFTVLASADPVQAAATAIAASRPF